MSSGPESQTNVNLVEETRRQINRLFEEVAKLAEMDIPPADFYGEFLKRVLHALAAPAGAVWGRTAQGNLQLQFQINMRQVGIDATEEARQSHDELLRSAVTNPRPVNLAPHSSAGQGSNGEGPGNPTPYLLLMVPIQVDNQVSGLLEVWQAPDRHPSAIPGFLQFMVRMAELATRFIRNNMLRTMVGQQQLWVQMEAFARTIHGSLNPVEVSYLIANEARRLVECDRVSIGVRYAKKVDVEAISGADVVEKRSNLVQLMRALLEKVIAWGEKLFYNGTKDDTLPPDVLKALDNYLAESNSKLLVVLPLKDERQGTDTKKPARSAMLMESFEPAVAPEQLLARLEVIARHATPALYNAVEHRRIPFRFIWMPLAKVQEGLGGKTKAIITLSVVGVLILIALLVFVPYPLKMDSKGSILPEIRRTLYPPGEGRAVEFRVKPNGKVNEDENLVLMFEESLRQKLTGLDKEIASLQGEISEIERTQNTLSQQLSPGEKANLNTQRAQKKGAMEGKRAERIGLALQTNSDTQPGSEGFFWLKAPDFPHNMPVAKEQAKWTVLNRDFEDTLINKHVRPSDPLLRLGYKEGPWEIELKIPQKHIGQVLAAFKYNNNQPLDVDILVKSDPTRVFKGRLKYIEIAGDANPHKDDNNESEPIVLATVSLTGEGIEPYEDVTKVAPYLLVSGTEVHAKIRCGSHRMGYSLFYGVWEFLYEKVVFFF